MAFTRRMPRASPVHSLVDPMRIIGCGLHSAKPSFDVLDLLFWISLVGFWQLFFPNDVRSVKKCQDAVIQDAA